MHSSGKSIPAAGAAQSGCRENLHRRLEARADALLGALELDRAGDDAAQIAQLRPFRAERLVAPAGRHVAIKLEMDARCRGIAVAAQPRFLGGEAQHRRQPAHEMLEHVIEHGARRAAAHRIRRIAIERVLAHVEIEGREIDGAEIMQRREHRVEIVGLGRLPHQRIGLGKAMQDIALELGHVRRGDALGRREAGERAEEIAQRVAQAAIDVGLIFQNLGADAQIFRIIRGDDPEPQDVGAALRHDLLRRDDIAQGFRHLAALLVEHEAMRQHAVIRRAAARAASSRAARNGTSRDAGRSPRDRARPASRDRDASPRRRHGSSRNRTRHRPRP